jgi:hypothetical protein
MADRSCGLAEDERQEALEYLVEENRILRARRDETR